MDKCEPMGILDPHSAADRVLQIGYCRPGTADRHGPVNAGREYQEYREGD
ncbi:MAG: hypothetical protein LBF22_07735 [Deltaproteobacteria bacterium]|nr:hypothetical protein [Deltaproteobacteria bacterium]